MAIKKYFIITCDKCGEKILDSRNITEKQAVNAMLVYNDKKADESISILCDKCKDYHKGRADIRGFPRYFGFNTKNRIYEYKGYKYTCEWIEDEKGYSGHTVGLDKECLICWETTKRRFKKYMKQMIRDSIKYRKRELNNDETIKM